jgi:hypothetical protein
VQTSVAVTALGSGRATARAIIQRLPIAAARDRVQLKSRGDPRGTGKGQHSAEHSTLIIIYHPELVQ